ncbi:MAG: type pilus assembly protein FimT [Pseudomonadota bacterium]|jgi:type IV fimbrial biogenesis protein FimT
MKKHHRGFTLIEALVVMGIVGIMASMGIPWFISIVKSSVITSNVNGFLADLRFARSESLRRGGRVVMCRSNAPEATVPVCNGNTGASNGWQTGWVIFHDLSGDNVFQAGEPILRVQSTIVAMDSIIQQGNSPSYKFTFSATGRLPLGDAATLNFGGDRFKNLKNPDNIFDMQRTVCVAATGRGRISGDGVATCP